MERLAFFDDGYFVVVEVDHSVGVVDNRGGVGGDVGGFVGNAYYEWRAFTRGDYRVGGVTVDNCDGVGSDYLSEGFANGGDERAVVGLLDVVDELDEDFGVGFALELASVTLEGLAEDVIVFDCAVMDDGYVAVGAEMGMGVGVVRLAVCGPAGVGDSD